MVEINLECFGAVFKNATLTAYYPDFDDEDIKRAYLDENGNKLMTLQVTLQIKTIILFRVRAFIYICILQDYMDDRNNYVTLAMDDTLQIPYGTPVCIPELNLHFGHRLRIEVRDTSSDLRGLGFKRADICVRSEIDSYDVNVNRRVTLVFEKGHTF